MNTPKLFLYMKGNHEKLVPLEEGSIEEINRVFMEHGVGSFTTAQCCLLSLVERINVNDYLDHLIHQINVKEAESDLAWTDMMLKNAKEEAGILHG
jgi:hypothetical protein